MVRLLAIRTAITFLKRAIRLSGLLRPSSWENLSVFCSAVFVLSAWGYWESQRSHTEHHYRFISFRVDKSNSSEAAWYSRSHYSLSSPSGVGRATLFNYDHVGTQASNIPAQTVSQPTDLDLYVWDYEPLLAARQPAARVMLNYALSFEDIGFDSRLGLPDPLRFFSPPPTMHVQYAPDEGRSLGKTLTTWATLFSLTVSPMVGVASLLLAWIGLHRKRAEEALLLLELEKRKLEIEKMRQELDLARAETNKPRIISD